MLQTSPSITISNLKMKRLLHFIMLFSAAICQTLSAQTSKTEPEDLQGWLVGNATVNLPKKWDVGTTFQWRTEGNISKYKGIYFSPEIGYKLMQKVRGFVQYRYATTNNGASSRVGLGMEYTDKAGAWNFDLRPQVQYTLAYAEDGDISSNSKWILRTRLSVRYGLSKNIDAFLQFEPFFTFDDSEYFIDNIRNTIGIKYEYAKDRKVSLFYIYRPDYARSYNRVFHVVGLKFDFDWKVKKRK